MTPQQAIDALHALPRGGHGTLDRMRALMHALGDPQDSLKCVQIAGTNGKGTLAVMTACILQKAGYKTGLTISPYVTDFRERFQIDGEMIPPQTLADLTERVLDAVDAVAAGGESPREFEAVTAVALLWFAQQQCDIVVLETGMGGAYDATNIVPHTLVAAITRIGMDHMEFLGDTLAEIAAEKAGIIKEGCTVVCYPDQPAEAMGPILTAAANAHTAIVTPEAGDLIRRKCRPLENYIDYGGYSVMLRLPGRHQGLHAAMAVEIALTLWRNYGFAKYLHDSLPNATYVGFTGTPIDATIEVFGPVVERYTMTESVKDGITVNLVYEGRAAKVTLDKNKLEEIEAYYIQCAEEGANENQIDASKKAIAHLDVILGDPDRLKAIAKDFVEHYEKRVAEGATVCGKAMFVCANRQIAYSLYKYIRELRPEWMEADIPDDVELTEASKQKEIKPMAKLNLVMTRSKNDPKELWDLLGNDDYRKELDRQFKNPQSNFKIAMVVDMWLTGFDVPELDTMYIDKPVQQHTLIQTISRVNRVCKGKDKGLIVDYIGIKNSMNKALRIYTDYKETDLEEVGKSVIIVRDTLEILDSMFKLFNATPFYEGTPIEQLDCLNHAVEYVQITKESEDRFMSLVKRLKDAYNLCSGGDELGDSERSKIHFYLAVRSVLFKLTKGDAPDTEKMNKRVSELIEDAIVAEGVSEVFSIGKDTPRTEQEIFSDGYLERINRIPMINTKIKLLQRLLKRAIDDYRKVNRIKGIDFTKRMNAIVDLYNARRKDKAFANEVLDDIAEQLTKLLENLNIDKQSFKDLNISFEEKAFFDILEEIAKKYGFYDKYVKEYGADKLVELAKEIKAIVDDKSKYAAWSTRDDIKAELKVNIILKLADYHYPPVTIDDVYKEILEQATNFRKYNGE